MIVQYTGIRRINGPLIVLSGVENVAYDELVEIHLNDGTMRMGNVVDIEGSTAVVQVFEGTRGMSLGSSTNTFLGHPMELGLSEEILGRVFDGAGRPADGLGPVYSEVKCDVNGLPINPISRKYPRNYIQTGISSIDGLITLIRGQKLPVFSGNGMPHDKLAAQIVKQAGLVNKNEKICRCFRGNRSKTRGCGIFPEFFCGQRGFKPRRYVSESYERSCGGTYFYAALRSDGG